MLDSPTMDLAVADPTLHAGDPVWLFDVAALGVSLAELQRRVAPSFHALAWDQYDVRRAQVALLSARFPEHAAALDAFLPAFFAGERELDEFRPLIETLDETDRVRLNALAPRRRRAIAHFLACKTHSGHWMLERQPDSAFTQPGDDAGDYRQLERRFAPSPRAVTDAPAYRAVLEQLAAVTDQLHPVSVSALRIVCHQMGLWATPDGASNAPEGIHQDGADYIVSALVLERRNVSGGESVVYGPDKSTEYLRDTLREGEGIFQADAGSSLWHGVTPIRPTDPDAAAYRNILGYDIHVLD